MSTQTITEFLEARIAEDEAVARRVADGPGEPGGHGMWSVAIGVSGNDAKFAHVASDPARVLAECAAKRAIIGEHGDMNADFVSENVPSICETCHDYDLHDAAYWPCLTLKALAAVYKDHADYQEVWAL